MSGDEELGWVYLPTGTPTSGYYGGHRLGDNLFAESLVAVDVETGQRQWRFQTESHAIALRPMFTAFSDRTLVVTSREMTSRRGL